jgi:hypothetical protein
MGPTRQRPGYPQCGMRARALPGGRGPWVSDSDQQGGNDGSLTNGAAGRSSPLVSGGEHA